MFRGYSALIISVHHAVTHQNYVDTKSDDDNATQHFWLMVTKKFYRGTFENGITITNSGDNRSGNTHHDASDININCPLLPPGGGDAPRQTDQFSLVWEEKSSADKKTKKKASLCYLFVLFLLISCVTFFWYHTSAHTNTHIRPRVFVCTDNVSNPFYSLTIMPKTQLLPRLNGSQTIRWASWSLCLSSSRVENPQKLCAYVWHNARWMLEYESHSGWIWGTPAAPVCV